MDKIITNKIKCRTCGDVIESVFTHDLKRCKCGAVEIDGGKEYLRRSANSIDDFIELSTVINADDEIQEKDMLDTGVSKELLQKDIKIPKYLQQTLEKQRRIEAEYEKTKDDKLSIAVSTVWEEVYVDINQALISDAITDEEAYELRKKYLGF